MSKEMNEEEKRKKAIYEMMSPRRKKYVEKVGYDKWDPFQEPKDPIDIRKDKTKRTSQMLVREFLQTKSDDTYSPEYGRGVLELCIGIINDDERFLGMYEFSIWYQALLKAEGHQIE